MDKEQIFEIAEMPPGIEPHLREVIEREPIALARVGKDGTLLAVNEAAQSMLGAGSLEQILGTPLHDLAIPEQRESLQEFFRLAADGDRGSYEADLVGLTGKPHALDIRASQHPGAPDGIPSSLLTFHDVSALRRVEQALEEAAQLFENEAVPSRAQLDDLRKRFEAAQAERRNLLASSALLRVEATFHRHTADDHMSRLEALELSRTQAVDTAQALQAALDEREAEVAQLSGRLHELESERRDSDESSAETRQKLESQEARANELDARVNELAAHASEVAARAATLERTLADEREAHQRRLSEFERAAAIGAGSSAEVAEVAMLTVRMAELEATHATKISELAVAHAGRLATMQRSLADLQRTHEQRVSEIEEKAASRLAAAEQTHVSQLAVVEGAHVEQRTALESTLNASRAALDESQAALDESRVALNDSKIALSEAVARSEAALEERRRVEAAFAAERQRLEADLQAAVESDRETRHALAAAVATWSDLERKKAGLLGAITRLADEAQRIDGEKTAVDSAAVADEQEGR